MKNIYEKNENAQNARLKY